MRILFVGDGEDYAKATEGSWQDMPGSLFLAPELPTAAECGDLDAMILPVAAFLRHAPGIHPCIVLASGPSDLIGEAFAAGCADYLREPWAPDELFARVRLRGGRRFDAGGSKLVLKDGILTGCKGCRRLDPAAIAALALLSANQGRLVPREALASVMGIASRGDRAVDMRISRLRAVLGFTAGPESSGALRAGRIPGGGARGYSLAGS